MVSCTNGTPITGTLPATFTLNEIAGNQEIWVVGCKAGYAQSPVEAGPFTVNLNAPTFSKLGGATVYDNVVAVSVDDTANKGAPGAGGGEYVCVTTDGTTATCAAGSKCGGTGTSFAGGVKTVVPFPAANPTANAVNVNGAILQAAACQGTTAFTNSSSFSSGAYDLQLDPIQFLPKAGTPIPASGSLPVIVSQNGTGLAYDYILTTTDAASGATLTCASVPSAKITKTAGATTTVTVTPAAGSIWAVGCLNPPVVGTDTNVFAASNTPAATAAYQAATVMATPTITPGGTINNPVRVQFVNNEPTGAASGYFCYTTNGSAPALASATIWSEPTIFAEPLSGM